MNKPALLATGFVLSSLLVFAQEPSKADRAKLMEEAALAYKYAVTAEGLREKAERRGDAKEAAAQEQIADENFSKLRPVLDQLADSNDKKAWKFLTKVVDRVPERYGLDEVVLKAATTMTDPEVQGDIKKGALGFKSPKIRRALVLHLANQKEWGVLLRALKDKDEAVASLAAWRLMDNRVEAAVVPLIDELERLERGRGGIWDVLNSGLGRMLGKKCNSAIEYRSLWEILQGQGGLASVQGAAEAEERPAGELSSGVRLFGREIDCTRAVFILDVSGSMDKIDPDQEIYDEGGGSRARDTGASGQAGREQLKTRLQRAQRELKNVINRLPANFKINIVAYSSNVKIWRAGEGDLPPQLHELNAKNRQEACEFVDQFRADGVTATDTALLRGYDVDGARCFYLLSDGFATHDGRTPVPTEEILSVLESFKDRHVIVHTLGFKEADVEMMRAVAEKTGGRYSDIR